MSAYGTNNNKEEEEALVGELGTENVVESKSNLSRAFYRVAMAMVASAFIIVGALGVTYTTGSGGENFRGDGSVLGAGKPTVMGKDLKKNVMQMSSTDLVNEFAVAWDAGDEMISSCQCNGTIRVGVCQDTAAPAWLGIDLVELYNKYQDDTSITYNDYIPEYGLTTITTDYAGYEVRFLTTENKVAFMENPDMYTPEYGGFCSFGVAAEYCNFDYIWDKDCLGPEASLNAWQYLDDKLYFYRSSAPLKNFNLYQDEMLASANQRWASWFSATDQIVNSGCMLEDKSDSTWGR